MKSVFKGSLVRYIVVGITSLSVDYAVLLILYHVMHVPLPLATSVAFLLGLIVNFLLNKYWSFQAATGLRRTSQQAVLYTLLVGFNLAFTNVFIVYLASASIGPELSKPATTLMITLWNYILYKTVIFKGEDQDKEPTV